METAEKGSVFTVAFAPVIPFDLTYAIESKDVSVAVCNKEGKNLLNAQQEWNMKNGDEVIVLYTKTGEAPSLMVYPKIVVVSFDANGGTGTMEEQTFQPDTATALTKNKFTKTGWTFTGWNTAKDGTGTAYADAAEVKLSADAILFAQWKQDSVKVTFDANTGSGTMEVQTMAANTATVLTANAFTKEGWTFSGWNTAKDGKGISYTNEAEVELTADITLYAQWQENVVVIEKVTVTFDANGGTGIMSALTMDANTTTPLTKNTFTREGWTFTGWNTAKDGTGTPYANGAAVSLTADITLYAQWQENVGVIEKVTVTFDANGGTGSMLPQYIGLATSASLNKSMFTKEGESFISWNTAKDGTGTTYADEQKVTLTNNLTLYAQYEYVALISVVISNSDIYMETGYTAQLNYTLYPANSSNRNVIWTSSNEAVATVSASGEVTAVSSGITLITVTTVEGSKKDVCELRVGTPVVSAESISLSSDNVSMETGSQLKLIATVVPENADLNWYSSDSLIATVVDGFVTAKKAGTVIISVNSPLSSSLATCTITVTDPVVSVEGLSLNKEAVTLVPGYDHQLVASLTPLNATNKNLTWVSSNSSVASVSDTGLVTAWDEGTAVITVTSEEGGWTDTCTVTVQASGLAIVFEGLTDETMDISYDTGIVSKSNYYSITISYDGLCDYITWYVDNMIWTSEYTMNFYASQYSLGNHTITAIIEYNGNVYSKSVTIRVVE